MKGECGLVEKSGLVSTEAQRSSGLAEQKVLSSGESRSGVLKGEPYK